MTPLCFRGGIASNKACFEFASHDAPTVGKARVPTVRTDPRRATNMEAWEIGSGVWGRG
jgi:hypothetical protein